MVASDLIDHTRVMKPHKTPKGGIWRAPGLVNMWFWVSGMLQEGLEAQKTSPTLCPIHHFHLTLPELWFVFFLLLLFLSYVDVAQLLSHVRFVATQWTAALQASLSITNSQSLLKLMSIGSVMPSSHLILCSPLLLLPPNPPSIRVFSNELTLHMRWPKYWSFSLSISPSNEGWFLLGLTGLIFLFSKGLSGVFSSTTVRKHQLFDAQPFLLSNSYSHTWLLGKP